jgi:hypothetical protein
MWWCRKTLHQGRTRGENDPDIYCKGPLFDTLKGCRDNRF